MVVIVVCVCVCVCVGGEGGGLTVGAPQLFNENSVINIIMFRLINSPDFIIKGL